MRLGSGMGGWEHWTSGGFSKTWCRSEHRRSTPFTTMPLKFKCKTKEEIPAEHLPLYAERDGAWVLDVDGAVEKAKLDEFRSTNVALLKERDDLKKRFDGIDPEEFKRLQVERQRVEEGKLLKEGDVEKIVLARLKAALDPVEKRAQAAEQSAAKMTDRLAEIEINRGAIVAATKLGLRPTAIPDLTLRARCVFRMVDGKATAFDADGKSPLYGPDGLTPLSLDDWAAKLVVEAPHLFEPNAGGGATGSNPGSGAAPVKNPFKRGADWNLTEQMKLSKRDPKLADRLKAAA